MPEMILTRVDFPAPLSPTSAVTCPAYASKSTPRRTWTGPNDLSIPRRRMVGTPAPDTDTGKPGHTGECPDAAQRPSSGYLIPAVVHSAAKLPVQTSAAFW